MKRTERVLNCLVSRDQERDWGYAAAVEGGVVQDVQEVPEEVDLRHGWWAVRDQGRTGACVGFAVADGVLRYQYVQEGWIGEGERTSPRFIWMADKETDEYVEYPTTFLEMEGTYVKNALRVARKYGCVLEKDLPMKGRRSKLSMEGFYTRAARLRIATFHNLGMDLDVWKRWIAGGRPVATSLDVDSTFSNAGGDGDLSRFRGNVRGGHAVSVVGYTRRRFIVRNSWGTGWGDGGYGYATPAYVRDAFREGYGAVL